VALVEHGGFRKSSYSWKAGKCVEVKIANNVITVRHSVNIQTQIEFTSSEWEAFLQGVKDGEFDLVTD
jgi:hypothetical protein